jgi:hypothetical protein
MVRIMRKVSAESIRRERLQIIGVFGEGSGEALLAKRASPVTLHEAHRFCNRLCLRSVY